MDRSRFEALLEEATVDCYGDEEEFWGVFCTLDEHLNFPLQARALSEPTEVVGLDEEHSSLRRGIVARVCKGEREYSVALAELEFVNPDLVSVEWLEVYQHWLGQ